MDRMFFGSVNVEVNPHSLELLPLNVAYEAFVFIVFLDLFLLPPHVCKGVYDDTWNDGSDYQVYE